MVVVRRTLPKEQAESQARPLWNQGFVSPCGTGQSELVPYLVFGDGLQKFFHWDICANHTQKNAL